MRPRHTPHTERLWGVTICGSLHVSDRGKVRKLFHSKRDAEAFRLTLQYPKSAKIRPVLVTPLSVRGAPIEMDQHHTYVRRNGVGKPKKKRKSIEATA